MKHWYQGWIQKTFCDDWTSEIHKTIKSFVKPETKVLDVGCGSGTLAFQLAEKCSHVTGLEISSKLHSMAQKTLAKSIYQNLSFLKLNIMDLDDSIIHNFDYIIMSLFFHEINENDKMKII